MAIKVVINLDIKVSQNFGHYPGLNFPDRHDRLIFERRKTKGVFKYEKC